MEQEAEVAAAEAAAGARQDHDTTRWVELATAALLALAALAAAWSSYEATRWSGEQRSTSNRGRDARLESTRASTEAGQLVQIDVQLFTQWLSAFAEDRTELADFYRQRFRPEFSVAFEAWVATAPRTNPEAPPTPFAMPEYRLEAAEKADQLQAEAERLGARASELRQRAESYVLTALILALVLFFAGISSKFKTQSGQFAGLGIAVVVFVGALVWLASMPVVLPK